MKTLALIAGAALFTLALCMTDDAEAQTNPGAKPQVQFKTSMGEFTVELEPERAPKTVANFLAYVREGHYDGTIFHRVIKNFMVQGGGFTGDYRQKPTKGPIANEADRGLANDRGTIAMARTSDPNSATAQFFVNVVSNGFLNHTAKTAQGWGYTAFGRVTDGMNIVVRMSQVETGRGGPFDSDVPKSPIVIEKATIIRE
jgi:peptidyl-prolyl cis-trans isomerase B (cyclophilin B)